MSNHCTILVTGFEPFDGSDDNPSARVIEQLAAAAEGGGTTKTFRLHTMLLPVSVRRAPGALERRLKSLGADVVLLLGEARGATCVRLERIAINVMHAEIRDNDGAKLSDRPVIAGGAAAYWATLPHKRILQAIRGRKIPCMYSFSAGTYLCNLVMYRALHWCAANRPGTQAGFIHLPSLPSQMHKTDQPKPTMELAASLRAVEAALEVVSR